METIRTPFQGIANIVKFNWHFYLLSIGLVLLALFGNQFLDDDNQVYGNILCLGIVITTTISLLVSYYVYDLSDLYTLNWLDGLTILPNNNIINISAGFDETSSLLKNKFPTANLQVFDFYDPEKNTEVSIKRARKAYPPFPGTQKVRTDKLPLPENYANTIFIILSAHEIRAEKERITFFTELEKILKNKGQIVVTEHLRDLPNFLAYNIGFFHFLSKSSWYKVFKNAGLEVRKEIKITPFISTYILEKHGSTS